ncbi:hypothetical protein [Arenibacter lacus]|uniref:hypothetical protein n=1 Tax=Arenibacter lacus TaxID=2608629 RepID=UPI00123D6B4E|nr:hypothetical protein [Arenibacter lacus]
MRKIFLTLTIALSGLNAIAQTGIGIPSPNPSTQLHIEASDKGVLIPQVSLTSLTDATSIEGGNVNSLLVFNPTDTNSLAPGYYYWFQTEWKRLMPNGDIFANVKYDGTNFFYLNDSGVETPISLEDLVQNSETNTFIRKENAVVETDGTVTSPTVYYYFSEEAIKNWLVDPGNTDISTMPNDAPGVLAIEVVGDIADNFEYIINQTITYQGDDVSIEQIIKNISAEVDGNVIYVNDKNPNDPNAVDNWVFKYFDGSNYVTIEIGDLITNNQLTYEVAGKDDYVVVTEEVDANSPKLTTYKIDVKAAMPKFFYMPTILFDTSTLGQKTKDLHAEYLSQFTGQNMDVFVKNASAPDEIPHIPGPGDLNYYITDYDNTVLNNVSISDSGIMTYDVIKNAGQYSYITVIFVVK